MNTLLRVSSSPHIRSEENTTKIMGDVIIALLPATFLGIYLFGLNAALLVITAIVTAVASEAAIQKIRKKQITVLDLSAALTGLLLAMNLPPEAPIWLAIVGSIFAVVIAKQLFGGLGHNFINPALAARAFLVVSWTKEMTSFTEPLTDAVATATPLGLIKAGVTEIPSMMDVFVGNVGGVIGETSALALLLGGVYLLLRRVITYRIPVTYMGTVFVLTVLFNGFDFYMALYGLFAGGLILGAFFMATDYSSCPMSAKGQFIYAFGAGFLTVIIRQFGGYPEGVMFSILLMNVATPLIERYSAPKVFGGGK